MTKAEIIATVVLGLVGLGIMAGQGFQVNGWVLLFWGLALVVLVYSIVHREPGDSDMTTIGDLAPPQQTEEPPSTLAMLAERGATISFSPVQPTPQPATVQAPRQEPAELRVFEWRDGNRSDSRVEYRNWTHVVFILGGNSKQRGRAYIEIDAGNGKTPDRVAACFAGQDWWAHESSQLRPGEQYSVPVFMRLTEDVELWIDQKRYQHLLGYDPTYLPPGYYITDRAFMDDVHRQQLPEGPVRLRVVLIIGDVEHSVEHATPWMEFNISQR